MIGCLRIGKLNLLASVNIFDDLNDINQLAIVAIIVSCIYPSTVLLCHIRTSGLG